MGPAFDIASDYFIKTTKDLLIPGIPVSGIFGTYAPGAGSPTLNAGTVRNSGFEFSVSYKGVIKQNFSYGISYNITILNNEVLEVNNGNGFIEGGTPGLGIRRRIIPNRGPRRGTGRTA